MFGRYIVKILVVIVNIVVVGILLLSLLGTVVSPEKFIPPAYFVLAFPFIVLLNICFVIFWMLVRRWWFLLSLMALLTASEQIAYTFPLNLNKNPTEKENSIHRDAKSISILTYNTLMSGKLKKHRPNKPNKVIEYILDTDADIVCLQEFTVSKKEEYLTEEDYIILFSKYRYRHIEYQLEKTTRILGIATFSKFPIVNKHKIEYPSYANLSIYSDIDIDGEIVRVINNHLESNRLTEKDKEMPIELKDDINANKISTITKKFSKKLGAAYKIRAYQADVVADVIESSPHPVICCGDFNDVPVSYAYTRVKGRLADAFVEQGNGFGWTFHDRFYRFRIDYLMYQPKNISLIEFKLDDSIKYSDHYPILCNLSIHKTIKNN